MHDHGGFSVYGWAWRRLPGPVPVRVALAAGMLVLIVVALFGWVFPAFADGWLGTSQTIQ